MVNNSNWYGVCAHCNAGYEDQKCVGEECRVQKLQEKIDREFLEQVIRAVKTNADLRKELQKLLNL